MVGWRFCWWAIELLVNWRNCDRIDVSVIVCRLELGAVRRLVMSGAIDLLTPRRRTALVSSEVLMNPALSGSSNAAATLVFFSFTSWPKSSSDESPWEQLRKANSVLILRTALFCWCVATQMWWSRATCRFATASAKSGWFMRAVRESSWQMERKYSSRYCLKSCKLRRISSHSRWSWRRSALPESDRVLVVVLRRYLNCWW